MASAQISPQNSPSKNSHSRIGRSISWWLVLSGFVLLALSLLMFRLARDYRPKENEFVFPGKILRTAPAPPRASIEPAQQSRPNDSFEPGRVAKTYENGRKNSLRTKSRVPAASSGVAAARFNAASQVVISDAASASGQKDGNFLRRFFRWFAGLFKKKKKSISTRSDIPVVSSVTLSRTTLAQKRECPLGTVPDENSCSLTESQVIVSISASQSDLEVPTFKPSSDAGKFSVNGSEVIWDLEGAPPGIHELKITASTSKGQSRAYITKVNLTECECVPAPPPPYRCPAIAISAPSRVDAGSRVGLSCEITGGTVANPVCNWRVSAGKIISGQGTPSIIVDTSGLMDEPKVLVSVMIGSDPECQASASFIINGAMQSAPFSSIRGTVKSKSRSGIQGATVVAIGPDHSRMMTITDVQGVYEFKDLPPGDYRLEVTAKNFRTMSGMVTASNGRTVEANAELIPGQEMQVNGQPSNTRPPVRPGNETPPPANRVRKQDEIRVRYPERFLRETEGIITFELEEVLKEVVSSQTSVNGAVVVVDKPGPVPGADPKATLKDAFDGYDAYATVRLVADGLAIISPPAQTEQLLTGGIVKWAWGVKGAGQDWQSASFNIELDIKWKDKTGAVIKSFERAWFHEFSAMLGPPLAIKLANTAYPVPLGGGLLAIVAGAYPKRRKREDEVSSTVFSPVEAKQGDSFLVQVFAHLQEQSAALDEIAKLADETSRRRMTSQLKQKVKRGAELTFHLSMPGLQIDEPALGCVWDGEPAQVQFAVTVPQDFKPSTIIGTVIVSDSSLPIGHLKFAVKIISSEATVSASTENPSLAAANLIRYKQAFISYSSKDRPEVLKRVQMLNLIKLKFFQDLLTLEPGDEWEKLLYQYIDQSDVFFLFWSKSASESKWVRNEILYAMKRKAANEGNLPEIVPVIIEGPPPASPPEDLNFLHFNDKFIYFINTKDTGA